MSIEEINPSVHFHESLESLRLSNYDAALESINLAIRSNHSKIFYMFQKIKILFVAQMFTQCTDYITYHLKTLYKESPLSIFSQILSYYKTASTCSICELEDLLLANNIPIILAKQYPAFIANPNLDLLARILLSKNAKDYVTCIDYCDLFLNKDTSNTTVYLTKARCHHLLGEEDSAIVTYEKVIDLIPNTSSLFNEIGNAMLDFKNYPRAIACFEQAVKFDPFNISFTSQLAESFYLWKKYDSALVNFKKVLSQNPHCSETLLRIADIYEQMNRSKKAKKYYKKVLNYG